jgi:acyl-[acyl-carrier-protein]-phospholipid O-acyltransferase/long-chain-fatty-acid--[acyl-carrier-protein] ligase
LKRNVPQRRVGLVLPPGLGASVANLACVLSDKVPVNLNFTAGRALNEIALKRAGVETVLSAAAMQDKVKDFPWTAVPKLVDLKDLLGSLPKWRILLRWLVGFLLPAPLLRAAIGTPEEGGDREAALPSPAARRAIRRASC